MYCNPLSTSTPHTTQPLYVLPVAQDRDCNAMVSRCPRAVLCGSSLAALRCAGVYYNTAVAAGSGGGNRSGSGTGWPA